MTYGIAVWQQWLGREVETDEDLRTCPRVIVDDCPHCFWGRKADAIGCEVASSASEGAAATRDLLLTLSENSLGARAHARQTEAR